MGDGGCCALAHRRLGVKGNAQPGRLDHRQIIGTIANSHGFLQAYPQFSGIGLQVGKLGLAALDRLAHHAGKLPVFDQQFIGMVGVEAKGLRNCRGKVGEAA